MDAKEVLSRSHLNLHLCVKSLNELFNTHPFLSWEDEDRKVLKSNTISFYRLSLHYMFVSEYCKLLEPVSKKFPNSNISSLYQLIDACLAVDKNFLSNYNKIKDELTAISNHKCSQNIRTQRDKKLIHSDAEIEDPGKFIGFSLEEIGVANSLLIRVRSIIRMCAKIFGLDIFIYIPDRDYQTQVFIHNHTKIDVKLLVQDRFNRFDPRAEV